MNRINWNYCQSNSDRILSGALNELIRAECIPIEDIPGGTSGNYLISYKDTPLYVGEAKDVKKRLKQQFGARSTFYKTYADRSPQLSIPNNLAINDFNVRAISSRIGRKEVEEFGIVNLATPLNKFQLDKRDRVNFNTETNEWSSIQTWAKDILADALGVIVGQPTMSWSNASIPPLPGLYQVIDSNDELIYIGESSNIKDRYGTHSRQTRFSALRRHIATEILGYSLKSKSELGQVSQARREKRMYLTQHEDFQVDEYLLSCKIKCLVISFGRFEFEEFLIGRHRPMLNRKSKP